MHDKTLRKLKTEGKFLYLIKKTQKHESPAGNIILTVAKPNASPPRMSIAVRMEHSPLLFNIIEGLASALAQEKEIKAYRWERKKYKKIRGVQIRKEDGWHHCLHKKTLREIYKKPLRTKKWTQ